MFSTTQPQQRAVSVLRRGLGKSRLNRRRWLCSLAGAMAVPAVVRAARLFASETPRFEVQEVKTISRLPHRYHGWPTVTRRKNGQLVLVYSGGREAHVCPFGRVEMMTSHDEGQWWTYPQVLWDSAIDDRDSGVLETARGTLLVTTFTSLAYVPLLTRALEAAGTGSGWPAEKLDRWRAAHERLSEDDRQKQLGVWMMRSEDGGVTWSAPYDCLVNSPHGPIQLQDGRLLYAGKDLWRTKRVGVCVSQDDGRTWEWLATLPVRQGDDPNQYHELHAVETTEGRLVLQLRNHNPQNAGETLQCESDDGGKTWSTPHSIGVWGLPSHLIRLRDGRLLMSYGHRREPFGCQARLSSDGGRTWSEPLVIYGEGAGSDLGYPSTVELADGGLLTIWYELLRESPFAVLRQARWRLL
ncbi:MAG: sialidase family protein [Thermogutta sp.]